MSPVDGTLLWEPVPAPSLPDPAAGGCPRWPETLRLRSSHGELVRGRCRSTNQCSYCARLGAVENAELLSLDALAGSAPAMWAVLTTATPSADPARFYRSRSYVLRALRRRWPACEYAALVEFTTGYGPLSGGKRRPHWNLLLKGIPAEDLDDAQAVIRRVWCAREDARPEAQFVGLIGEMGGLMRYLALHFQKESQAPPAGWRGHRFLKSRGYLATSTPEARAAARASLRHKRELWRAIERGLVGQAAEDAAQEAIARAESTSWELVALDLSQTEQTYDPQSAPAALGAAPPTPSTPPGPGGPGRSVAVGRPHGPPQPHPAATPPAGCPPRGARWADGVGLPGWTEPDSRDRSPGASRVGLGRNSEGPSREARAFEKEGGAGGPVASHREKQCT